LADNLLDAIRVFKAKEDYYSDHGDREKARDYEYDLVH
jgi:hypothetical protein